MTARAADFHPFFSNRRVVFLLATLCCLLWGSSYPAIKNGFAMFALQPDDMAGKLVFDPDIHCTHHDEGRSCGSHCGGGCH